MSVQTRLLVDIERAGGWDSVFDVIADGATVADVARKFNVSRSFFSRVMVKDPERKRRAKEAYAIRAELRAEETLELADNVAEDADAIKKAELQVRVRQWLAGVDNERYRRANQPQIQVNVGQLFLDSLRHPVKPPPAIKIAAPVTDVPVEIEPEPGDTP